jgi:ATP-binding cassette subfamily C protein
MGMAKLLKVLLSYTRELFYFARYKVTLNMALTVTLGFLEGIGILMLIPFLALAGVVPDAAGAGSELIQWMDNMFAVQKGIMSLPVVLAAYVVLVAARSGLQRWQTNLAAEIQYVFNRFLSVRLYRSLSYASWPFLLKKRKSDLSQILMSELTRVNIGTQYFQQMLGSAFITVIQIGIAFAMAPYLTLLVLAGGLVLFVCMQSLIRRSRLMGTSISEFNRSLFAEATEHFNGIKEVKSYGIEAAQVNNFEKLLLKITDSFIGFTRVQSQTDLLYKVGAAVLVSIFFYFALQIFHMNARDFLIILFIFARLWPRFSSLQVGLQYVVMMLPAFRAVDDLIKEGQAAQENILPAAGGKILLKSKVDFCNVTYRYDRTKTSFTLRASFVLPAGSTTAIVGPSGSGKSTLADLLMGLLQPDQGEILLDGVPLNEKNMSGWRQSIGYVPQDSFLFNASIRDNLRWVCPDAAEEEIWRALHLAAIGNFIKGLPEGLDTVLGDRGVRLSGGERQRIVLARALLKQPAILLLDEATSSLDLENEQRIQQAIEKLHGQLTIVLIAHRLTTIRNADQILVLEDGEIIEQGSYNSLMQKEDTRFYALAHQFQ